MFKINRKQKIKKRYYDLFLYYQKNGDWEKTLIYGERYLNFNKSKKNETNRNLSGII
jgi:hypothetical protein